MSTYDVSSSENDLLKPGTASSAKNTALFTLVGLDFATNLVCHIRKDDSDDPGTKRGQFNKCMSIKSPALHSPVRQIRKQKSHATFFCYRPRGLRLLPKHIVMKLWAQYICVVGHWALVVSVKT